MTEPSRLARIQGMLPGPCTRLFVKPLHVSLELVPIDAPHPPAPDLDRRQVARSNEGVDLRDADAQVGGDVFEREEARLDGPATLLVLLGHRAKLSPASLRIPDLTTFAYV